MPKQHLSTGILTTLVNTIGAAARKAQSSLVRAHGKGAFAQVFAASDALVSQIAAAIDALQDDASTADAPAPEPKSAATSGSSSSEGGSVHPQCSEFDAELEALLEDRWMCIKPVLAQELIGCLYGSSASSGVSFLQRLRRNVAGHGRSASAHRRISVLNEPELKAVQRSAKLHLDDRVSALEDTLKELCASFQFGHEEWRMAATEMAPEVSEQQPCTFSNESVQFFEIGSTCDSEDDPSEARNASNPDFNGNFLAALELAGIATSTHHAAPLTPAFEQTYAPGIWHTECDAASGPCLNVHAPPFVPSVSAVHCRSDSVEDEGLTIHNYGQLDGSARAIACDQGDFGAHLVNDEVSSHHETIDEQEEVSAYDMITYNSRDNELSDSVAREVPAQRQADSHSDCRPREAACDKGESNTLLSNAAWEKDDFDKRSELREKVKEAREIQGDSGASQSHSALDCSPREAACEKSNSILHRTSQITCRNRWAELLDSDAKESIQATVSMYSDDECDDTLDARCEKGEELEAEARTKHASNSEGSTGSNGHQKPKQLKKKGKQTKNGGESETAQSRVQLQLLICFLCCHRCCGCYSPF